MRQKAIYIRIVCRAVCTCIYITTIALTPPPHSHPRGNIKEKHVEIHEEKKSKTSDTYRGRRKIDVVYTIIENSPVRARKSVCVCAVALARVHLRCCIMCMCVSFDAFLLAPCYYWNYNRNCIPSFYDSPPSLSFSSLSPRV